MKEIQAILKLIDSQIDKFDRSLPKIERQIYREIQLTLKKLDLDSQGNIRKTTSNLRKIQVIRNKVERIMQGDAYKSQVFAFSNSIRQVSKLTEVYMNTVQPYKQSKYLDELQKTSISETRVALGIASKTTKNPEFTQRVVSRTMDIIELNVKSGSSFTDVNEQVRDFIVQDANGKGALQRYSNVVTTDALNQYQGTYILKAAEEAGLEWYEYVGSLIKDSRPWCVQMVEKRFAHRSELDGLTHEFPQTEVPLNRKTGLPEGMIAGTDGSNILQRRGG